MPTVLPNDTALVFPSYTVVSASAGSGKTYTLTQRFVQLLLSDNVQHNGLRNILAITFTNQAAAEMRQRLIRYLKLLSLGDSDKLAEAAEFLSLGPDRIREKAKVVLARILDDYSDLQIRTIDSFMATVFKTSSFEFGFQPDLDIVFDNRPLLAEAFEKMTRELRRDPTLRNVLKNILELLQATRTQKKFLWDPYSRIQREVGELYSKLSAREKEVLTGEGIEQSRKITEDLLRQVLRFRKAIEESGLEAYKNIVGDFGEIESGNIETVLERTKKTPDKIVKRPRGGIGGVRYEQQVAILVKELEEYNRLLDDLILWKSRNYYKPYIDAIAFVRETLDLLKQQKGEIFIDDINRLLRPHLRDERVVDAYLMLGEQIYHFLIDEFQDTAPIQWANLRPLIDNSLSQGGSLFVVGDRKQSIYAFRNADWRIMDRLMKQQEFRSAKRFVIPLDKNWRSYEKIIQYTTHVFEENIRASEYAEDATLSGLDRVGQKPRKEHLKKGIVEVNVLDWDEDTRPERPQILDLITDCRKRGFSYRDLAILTPQNDRVLEVSSWLNEAGIPVLPYSSLDIRTRKIIGEVNALLRFLDSRVDDLSFSTFLLGDVFRVNLEKDGRELPPDAMLDILLTNAREMKRTRTYKKLQEAYPELWSAYFEELLSLAGYLPLYDLVSEIYRRFRLFELLNHEESSLVKFLEIARAFGENDRNSLKDFVSFVEEEGESSLWHVQVPQGVNAVRVMTVHKAKGLEFPVVVVLFYDRDKRNERYFFSDEENGTRLLRITTKAADRIPDLQSTFDEQRRADNVDELNKLYVALTRAQHEMFVISVRGNRIPFPSQLLGHDSAELNLRPGAAVEPPKERRLAKLHHSNRGIAYDEVSRGHIGFLEMARGDFIHRVLSGIEFLEDEVGPAVDALIRKFRHDLFPGLDTAGIRSSLVSFLGSHGVAALFSRVPQRIVFSEKEFVAQEGVLLRMDRILIDPDLVTVIDFKTGNRAKEEYKDQMENYLRVLRDVYPDRKARGLLAYVDQRKVVDA